MWRIHLMELRLWAARTVRMSWPVRVMSGPRFGGSSP
jgi:hypothetical protein